LLLCHAVDMANNKFIPICDGLNGKIGNLIIDKNYEANNIDMPINILLNMNNLIEVEEEENETVSQKALPDVD
jgi:hypothetical protein